MRGDPEDHHTHTVEDAAAYEKWRAEYDHDDRPTRAEAEADERRLGYR